MLFIRLFIFSVLAVPFLLSAAEEQNWWCESYELGMTYFDNEEYGKAEKVLC